MRQAEFIPGRRHYRRGLEIALFVYLQSQERLDVRRFRRGGACILRGRPHGDLPLRLIRLEWQVLVFLKRSDAGHYLLRTEFFVNRPPVPLLILCPPLLAAFAAVRFFGKRLERRILLAAQAYIDDPC